MSILQAGRLSFEAYMLNIAWLRAFSTVSYEPGIGRRYGAIDPCDMRIINNAARIVLISFWLTIRLYKRAIYVDTFVKCMNNNDM